VLAKCGCQEVGLRDLVLQMRNKHVWSGVQPAPCLLELPHCGGFLTLQPYCDLGGGSFLILSGPSAPLVTQFYYLSLEAISEI
jgi:hypothetical protein